MPGRLRPPVAGWAQLGVAHRVDVAVHLGPALQRQPPRPVDLAEHGQPAAIGVDRLLRPAGGDHPGDVRLGVEGETHRHHVRRIVGPQRGEHGQMALRQKRQRVVGEPGSGIRHHRPR